MVPSARTKAPVIEPPHAAHVEEAMLAEVEDETEVAPALVGELELDV